MRSRKVLLAGRTPTGENCDAPGMAHKRPPIDDAAADALLRGKLPAHVDSADVEHLAAFLDDVRALAQSPAPAPTGLLAALMESGIAGVGVTAHSPHPTVSRRPSRGQAIAAKAVAGVTVALVSVTGAAAADVLPQTVQDQVSDAFETVTPLELPDSADNRSTSAPDIEERVADARDDGVADRSPAGAGGPADVPAVGATPSGRPSHASQGKPSPLPTGRPSSPGQQGLDRANDTPARGHAPTALPSPSRRPATPGAQATTHPSPRSSAAATRPARPAIPPGAGIADERRNTPRADSVR